MRTATAILFLSVASLLALGMTILYSSSMAQKGAHYLQMQALWGGAGLAACVMAAMIDYRWLRRINWMLFLGVLILLALVLVPGIGVYRSGSRRWLDLGIANFQPSELAKLSLIVMLAAYGEMFQGQIRQFWRGMVRPVLIALPMLALIFVEPDRGTTILLAAVMCSVLLLAGVRWVYVLVPAVLGIVFIVYSIMHDPVRMARIESWLHPELYKNETGYQAWQAMLGLGAGGWEGLGLGNGRQKLGFLPDHHTDFILAVVGEELGLAGTLGVVAGFIAIVLCGAWIAWRARDVFGLLLAGGITLLIGLQASINIGVVTSTLPTKGLALPFISYGGSSLLLMLFCVGVLLSVARHAARDTVAEPAAHGRDLEPQFA